MRTRLALLLAALLLLTAFPARGEGGAVVYRSDFTSGTDGWYARSTGAASLFLLPEGALGIRGRGDNWHSPGRDFALIPGGRYVLRAQVRQDQQDSAGFMISVAHSRDGAESYENLARAVCLRGEWTELRGEYTAGDYDRFVLYVETTDAPTLDFALRDFTVEAPDGLPEPTATAEPMLIEEAKEMPSLKEIYAGRFDIGICLPERLVQRTDVQALTLAQFSILTPENELKPEAVLDVPASRRLAAEDDRAVAVHFDAAAPLLDFARANGLKVHGHVLVWHSQTPEAFFHERYDPQAPLVSREIMLARLENYIRQVMAYMNDNYPGVVVSWDVVNEAVDDSTGALRASPWLELLGEDYVARAFALARRYAPENVLLYYNDYNTAYTTKQNGIVRLLAALIAEGNIDGYGFQMHHALASSTLAEIAASVERIAALGLRLRVSEMDIAVGDNSKPTFLRQAERYAEIMKLLDGYSDQFEAVQFWGLTDDMSWRSGQYPLLFDGNMNPKPAFWAVAEG